MNFSMPSSSSGGDGLQGEAKIVMGPISNTIANDTARLVAVVADAEHSGGEDSDVTFA
jgi:hypothetical protein